MKRAKKLGLVLLILVMAAGVVFARGQGGTESAGGGGSR